jgi:hypothetical protein
MLIVHNYSYTYVVHVLRGFFLLEPSGILHTFLDDN